MCVCVCVCVCVCPGCCVGETVCPTNKAVEEKSRVWLANRDCCARIHTLAVSLASDHGCITMAESRGGTKRVDLNRLYAAG